jgi:hypothetical protein
MSIIDIILRRTKPAIWRRFLAISDRKIPIGTNPPVKPEDALAMGYRMGLQAGYGEGLADGVGLGMDVGMYTATSPAISQMEPFDVC